MPPTAIAPDCRDAGTLSPVAVGVLVPTDDLQFSLYYCPRAGSARLLLARHHPLTSEHIDALVERGVETLYIATEEADGFGAFLLEHVIKDEQRAPAERLAAVREAMKGVFSEALRRGHVGEITQATGSYGSHLVGILTSCDVLFTDLVGVMTHDYSTFTHATNVAANCLLLARSFGIAGQQDLLSLTQGALLHDLGKRFIGKGILQKKGPLTSAERAAIQLHPTRGFETLCLCPDGILGWDPLMMVYQHHERWDGSGYPVGLVGTEIHPWARICAIADVFDALTHERAYHGTFQHDKVLDYLDREAGQGFDKELVQCWISVVTQKR